MQNRADLPIRQWIRIAIFALFPVLFNCDGEEDHYPIEPNIESAKVRFLKGTEFAPDTLRITFIYTDGDEDVGLDYLNPQHSAPPFHSYVYFLRSTGAPITSDKLDKEEVSEEELITYEDRDHAPYDTLPPLSECNYRQGLYFIKNENYFNFNIDVLQKESSGNYILREFPFCDFLKFRLPVVGTDNPVFKVNPLNPKRAEVIFNLLSVEFHAVFHGEELKLGLQIKDRNLNKSNYYETHDFVIQ